MLIDNTRSLLFAVVLSPFLLSGCASFEKTIDINHIRAGQSAVAGKINLVRRHWISGELVSTEEATPGKVSFAVKECKSPSDIPTLYIGYAGVKRLLTDKNNSMLVPISPRKYCLVDAFGEFKRLGDFIQEEFSRHLGVKGTLILNVVPGKINYIGDITVFVDTESYEDTNKDGYIDGSEFKSSMTDFETLSGGKGKLSAMARWRAVYILVKDNFNDMQMKDNVVKSIPDRIEF